MMINQATIIGNLGQDPETRYMPSGDAVTNISVATTKRWKKDGEQKEATEWHKVTAFGKLAEIMAEYLRKGSQVFIQGELRTRKWDDKAGVTHYTTEIIADTMKMLGKKRGEDSAPAGQRGSLPPKQETPQPGPDDFDDDIPF